MRIVRIAIDHLRLPLDPPFLAAWDPEPRRAFDATLVRVETDEGLVGVGSGDTMGGFGAYERLFLGTDPLRMAEQVRRLETVAFHGGRPWPLEAALWDIAGQVAGQPVARLLGGAADRIPAYASTGELRDPAARADSAVALAERGFRAIKLRIDRQRTDEGIAAVAAVRQAVGDRMAIMVDLNQWWRMAGDVADSRDPQDARRVVERLAEHDVTWVEEPLLGVDLAGMRMLREQTGVRIAGGEMVRDGEELWRALDEQALDVLQPDVVLALGMSRARTLAERTLQRGRWFTPHTWTNGLGLLANLHVVCGVGGGPFLEYPIDPPGWTPERRDFLLAEPVGVDADGCVRVPDAPGLGAIIDDDAIAHHAVGRAAVGA